MNNEGLEKTAHSLQVVLTRHGWCQCRGRTAAWANYRVADIWTSLHAQVLYDVVVSITSESTALPPLFE